MHVSGLVMGIRAEREYEYTSMVEAYYAGIGENQPKHVPLGKILWPQLPKNRKIFYTGDGS
tara:strand:- start:329 stop:511 length:183 start_codon:yes stop_codon:yes gene_type:complete